MREYEILDLIAETADIIADYHGMNVPYCESMDMSLFHQPILAMLDEEEADLGDLQFLAQNNRLVPDSLPGSHHGCIPGILPRNTATKSWTRLNRNVRAISTPTSSLARYLLL